MPDPNAVCDFCSAAHPTWLFPVPNLLAIDEDGVPLLSSAGAWAACDVCVVNLADGRYSTIYHRLCRNARTRSVTIPGARDVMIRLHKQVMAVAGKPALAAVVEEHCTHPKDAITQRAHGPSGLGRHCVLCGTRLEGDTP